MNNREEFEKWHNIQKEPPKAGELVLIYDTSNFNGLDIKYFIGKWDEEENAFIHHTGYKYTGNYWMRLSDRGIDVNL
jgi:hypothetical protein